MNSKVIKEIIDLIIEEYEYVKIYQSKKRSYGKYDMYQAECHTIEIIGDIEGITAKEIAEKSHKTKSAVSQMIKKLREKDFIVEENNEDNHREKNLYLTKKGMKVYEYHKGYDEEAYTDILSKLNNFSNEDLTKYIEIQKILNNIFKSHI